MSSNLGSALSGDRRYGIVKDERGRYWWSIEDPSSRYGVTRIEKTPAHGTLQRAQAAAEEYEASSVSTRGRR
jgi:hypothetical protein